MRVRLWLLNLILSSLVTAIIITYLADVVGQNTIGLALIMMACGITTMVVSRLILGPEKN